MRHCTNETESLCFYFAFANLKRDGWRCTRLVTWFALTLNVASIASNPGHQLDPVITRFSLYRSLRVDFFLWLREIALLRRPICLHAIGCYDWPSCQQTRWTIKKIIPIVWTSMRKIPRKRMSHGSRRFLWLFFLSQTAQSPKCTVNWNLYNGFAPVVHHLWSLGRFTMEFTCCEAICIIDQACTSIVASVPSVNENWLFKCRARNVAEDFYASQFSAKISTAICLEVGSA
jgi:hypothetical protein